MYQHLSGMGWSEGQWSGVQRVPCGNIYPAQPRTVCFADNDVDRRTAADCGCTRIERTGLARTFMGELTCTTHPSGNRGHFYCCPNDCPRPYPATAEAQSIRTEREQGAIPGTSGKGPIASQVVIPPVEQPTEPQPPAPSVNIGQYAGPAVAIVLVAGAGFMAYRFFTR